ncbi:MAG: hypothetical protein AABX83_03875 [Nanoarchaeota archaeon]
MAFVLVALLIFFSIVALFYFSIAGKGLKESASSLREAEAKELIRKLASSPEFSFTASTCANCIDLDKALLMKYRESYKEFFNLEFLQIEKIYPDSKKIECDKLNYPDCTTITIIDSNEFGSPKEAFVSLCRWEQEKSGYFKCELGRIYASGKGID